MKLLIVINILFASFSGEASPDTLISCHFSNASFTEFCIYIEKSASVKIYFDENSVRNLKVSIDADSISPADALKLVLRNTPLKISEWNNGFIILPDEELPQSLPDYNEKTEIPDTTGKTGPGNKSIREKYLAGRKAGAMQIIRIGKKSSGRTYASIHGKITDAETGESLAGATIFLQETKSGAATGPDGYLTLVVKPGTYTAVAAFMGMESKKFTLEVISDGSFSIELRKSSIEMKEVVVYGDKQMNFRLKSPGVEKISVKEIKEIPMMMGERDIIKVSEMMPGIVTVGEGSAGINVRGGNYDQNAFYINHVSIYNTSHLFGFFPVFNADIIRDFSVYKGHIPANYGGHLSSVFDITGRQGNRKHFTAHGGISAFAANLSVEGPLKKDTSSFILSGRYLYSDWILNQIKDPLIRTSSAGFSDFSGAWNYDFRKSQLSVFLYHSQDKFNLSDITSYRYSNDGASISLSHNFGKAVRGDFWISGSLYSYRTEDMQEPPNAYKHSYNIGDYRFNADFTHELTPLNSLRYGGGVIFYKLKRGTVEPFGSESIRVPLNLGDENGTESAVYLSDSYDVLPWLNINAGIRFTLFTPLGPRTVYEYYPGAPRDPRYISDTLQFGNLEPLKWYAEPDFRAALIFKTDPYGTVKVAWNQMHQNLFVLNNTIALAPNSQWKLADYHIPPARANQISAGVFRTFPKPQVEASAEIYYKRVKNYPEFTDGADFLGNPNVEMSTLPGNQNAWGLELMVRRSAGKLQGWISYTYSRSVVKVNGEEEWQKINNGQAYPANYDIPNVLNTVLMLHISRRVTTSAVFVYQSGRPVTYPISVYYINGTPYLDYSKRNEYRIPAYVRLDLSLTIEGNLKKNKFLHSSFIFNLYNVTGRDNPYSVYFKLEDGKINSYRYSVIAVPVFTITWLFKLGNYASE